MTNDVEDNPATTIEDNKMVDAVESTEIQPNEAILDPTTEGVTESLDPLMPASELSESQGIDAIAAEPVDVQDQFSDLPSQVISVDETPQDISSQDEVIRETTSSVVEQQAVESQKVIQENIPLQAAEPTADIVENSKPLKRNSFLYDGRNRPTNKLEPTPPPTVESSKEVLDAVSDEAEQSKSISQPIEANESISDNTVENQPNIFDSKESDDGFTYLSTDVEHSSEAVTVNKGGYLLGFEDVVDLALTSSNEYLALQKELESRELLKGKEEKYFYPNTTLNSETSKYYGAPTPTTEEKQEFILKLESKLYGSAVKDKIAASQENLDAGNISLRSEELSIYYTVLKYLTKIELTREYQKSAEEYRKEIEVYYLKQVNATNEGVSTQTDAMEAKLSVAEFDESVYSVVANIEQYFKMLSEETGVDLNVDAENPEDKIGISYKRLKPLLTREVRDITPNELIASNAELQKIQKTLKSSLHNAKATRERLTIDLSSENHLVTNGDSGSSSVGDTNDSYVKLNVEFDLFNQGTQADADSAYKMYEAEKLRFDKQFKQYMDQYQTNLTNYNQQLTKRDKTAEQVEILSGLIENQKEEIYTDKVTYKDIVESISKLNKAQQTLLNIDLSLFDTLYEIETLISEKIL